MRKCLSKQGIILILMGILCVLLTSCKSNDYKTAGECAWYGDYERAIALYESLGNYKDSSQLLIEAMISHVTATAGKGSCTEALALAEDYLDTIGRENYNHCLYRIAEEYCSENTTESIEKGLDLFKRIPEDHPDYEHAKQRIADYQVLSRSSFNGQWYGEEFVSAVGHSYNISVWIRLRYANGFKLECTTKILDNSGFVWTENTVSFFADSVTDTKLGGRELQRHFELQENGRLWEYDNGAIYSLTRAE